MNSFSSDLVVSEDFSENYVSVSSVSEILARKNKKEIEIKKEENVESFLNKYCGKEMELFCSESTGKLTCLKENKSLLTGSCLKLMDIDSKNGLSSNALNIHDLRLPNKALYLGATSKKNYKDAKYKSPTVFYYRGLMFRKGYLTARNYAQNDYKGQFVVSSAYPREIFKDRAGFEFNPAWQKGPFFFDEAGNVKIGTLSKSQKYKDNIVLKINTLVVFNDKRELIKGFVEKPVRIGSCGFLSGMEISDSKIKECK